MTELELGAMCGMVGTLFGLSVWRFAIKPILNWGDKQVKNWLQRSVK